MSSLDQTLQHIGSLGNEQLNAAAAASVEAGAMIVKGRADMDQKVKAAGDWGTNVDGEVDAFLQQQLRSHCATFLSEELSPDTVEDGTALWVIDPIDGTGCYLNGDLEFVSVMIAFRQDFRTQCSLLLYPYRETNQFFYADTTHGAFVDGQPCTTHWSGDISTETGAIYVNAESEQLPEFHDQKLRTLIENLRQAGFAITHDLPAYAGIGPDIVHQEIVDPALQRPILAAFHESHPDRTDSNGHPALKHGPHDRVPPEFFVRNAGGWYGDLHGGSQRIISKKDSVLVTVNEQVRNTILRYTS